MEVEVRHDSTTKVPIYAALGVGEIWWYDGREVTIHHWHRGDYVEVEASLALSMLTASILSEYLARLRDEGELEAIVAFDEWLGTLQP